MKILVINPGATSTKICVFEDEEEVMRVGIDHEETDMNLRTSMLSAEEADFSSTSHPVHTR